MERPSYEGESIMDVCIRSYADAEALFGLLLGNGLAADAVLAAGRIVEIEERRISPITRVTERQRTLETARQSQAVVYAGQNLPDLALQEYGGVEGMFGIMRTNGLAAEADFVPGRMLAIAPDKVRKDVYDYYRRLKYKVNTGAPILTEAAEGEYNEDYNKDYTS